MLAASRVSASDIKKTSRIPHNPSGRKKGGLIIVSEIYEKSGVTFISVYLPELSRSLKYGVVRLERAHNFSGAKQNLRDGYPSVSIIQTLSEGAFFGKISQGDRLSKQNGVRTPPLQRLPRS